MRCLVSFVSENNYSKMGLGLSVSRETKRCTKTYSYSLCPLGAAGNLPYIAQYERAF